MAQSGEKIRVLIVDDISETRENLRKLLSFDPGIEVVGAAGSGEEGIALAREFHPHVILMDINMPGMDGITATQKIMEELPATQVVMLSVQGETDYLRRAMLAGARDFLTKPPSGDELMNTIRRVYEMGKARAVTMPAQPTGPGVGPAAPTTERLGNVVAVFSPKGGVGCTTVAVNLAIVLQQMLGDTQKVALMDASVQFGDVGVMLNLQASRTIADLIPHAADLDGEVLNSVVAPHGSGLKVLLAPPQPEMSEGLLDIIQEGGEEGESRSAFGIILDLMRQEFDLTIIDTWSWVDDITMTVFDAAALIVLIVMQDIPSIKSARLFLEVAERLGYPLDKIALVVNGVDRRRGIRVEQIEQAMIPVAAQIPLDEHVVRAAVNHGTPFVIRDRGRPVSQGIAGLARYIKDALTEEEEEPEEEESKKAESQKGVGRLRLGRRVFR